MFLTRKSLPIAALCCLGMGSAIAQEVPQTILDCTDLKRDAARLACFDREVAQLTQGPAGVASAPTSPTTSVAAAAPVAPRQQPSAASKQDEFGLSGDLARKRAEVQMDAEKPLDSIDAAVTKVTTKPYGELVVELDNGQVWQQLEAKKNFEIKEGARVHIKKGAMGSFFLIVDSGLSTRARRVR
jgi:hypothetical protein